jgi:hypothetical protein
MPTQNLLRNALEIGCRHKLPATETFSITD